MKKLWLVLTAAVLVICCSLNVLAADGKELLDSADVHITFDEKIEDANENYELYIEGDVELVEGRFGTAGNIVSGVNYIAVEELKFGTDSFTVSTWLNVHEHSGDPVLFGNKDWNKGTNTGWLLSLRSKDWKYNANSPEGSRTDTEYPFATAGLESETNSWYHLAIVVDRAANTYTLYVNGVKYGFSTDFAEKGHVGTYDDEVNQYTFNIGEDGTTIYNMGQTMLVDFDEFAVWKKALTAEEIVSVYTYAPEGYSAAEVVKSGMDEPLVFTSDANEVISTADVHIAFDGNVDDLTGNYTVTSVGTTAFTEGKAGQAASLKSGVNYLTVDGFKFGTDSFTISTWLNCHSFSSDPVILGNKDWASGANPGIALYYKNANWQYNMNIAEGTRSDDTYAIATSGVNAQYNEWANITIVVDREAQTSTFYVNGRQYSTVSDLSENAFTSALDDETNGFPLTIGEDGTGAYNASVALDMEMDELIVWKKALTADEIAAVYTLVAEGNTAGADIPAVDEAPAVETVYMSVEKTEFAYGEDIMVTAYVANANDWIGIYSTNDTLPGEGSVSSQWFYANTALNAPKALASGEGPLAGQPLEAGTYILYFLFNDGYEIAQTIEITVNEKAEAVETAAPETEAEVVETTAPETEAEVVETAAPETEAEVVEAPDAPQTFDFGVIAAIAAIISAAGYVVSRKK